MKFGHWLTLLGTASALVLLWSLRDVLIHVFAAIVLAMALCTAVGVVQRRLGWARPLALGATLLSLVVLGLGLGALLIPPFVDQFSQLLRQLPAAFAVLIRLIQQGLDQTTHLIDGQSLLEGAPSASQWLTPSQPGAPAGGGVLAAGLGGGALKLLGFAGSLGSALIQVLFVLAVSLMIAAQPSAYREVAILLVPSFYRRRFRKALLLCGEALSSWMGGVLISSCCVGLLAGIGLSLLGVKLVVANALLAGLLNVIPNVGPTLGTLFPMSVALLVSPWKAMAVLGLHGGVWAPGPGPGPTPGGLPAGVGAGIADPGPPRPLEAATSGNINGFGPWAPALKDQAGQRATPSQVRQPDPSALSPYP